MNRAGLLNVSLPIRECGRAPETVAHVMVHYRRFREARAALRDLQSGQVGFEEFGLPKWFIQLGILLQFNLAQQ